MPSKANPLAAGLAQGLGHQPASEAAGTEDDQVIGLAHAPSSQNNWGLASPGALRLDRSRRAADAESKAGRLPPAMIPFFLS